MHTLEKEKVPHPRDQPFNWILNVYNDYTAIYAKNENKTRQLFIKKDNATRIEKSTVYKYHSSCEAQNIANKTYTPLLMQYNVDTHLQKPWLAHLSIYFCFVLL